MSFSLSVEKCSIAVAVGEWENEAVLAHSVVHRPLLKQREPQRNSISASLL